MSESPDPWERREVERHHHRRSREKQPVDLTELLQRNQRPLILLVALVILQTTEVPTLAPLVRLALTMGGTILLLVAFAFSTHYNERFREAVGRGANPILILLLAWSGYCFFQNSFRIGAGAELLRLLAGVGAYLYSAYVLRDAREVRVFLGGVVALACGLALYDAAQFSQQAGANFDANRASVLGTHESIGSLLALLVPVGATLCVSSAIPSRSRLAYQVATLVLLVAWVMARCRSAWVGGLVSLVVLGPLLWRYLRQAEPAPTPPPHTRRHRERNPVKQFLQRWLTSPVPLVVIGAITLVVVGGLLPRLSHRVSGISRVLEDGSFATRLEMWQGGLRMLAGRPWQGWGLGSYFYIQGNWTHMGDSPQEVMLHGSGHQNIAHNYYIQWAADTGGVGVALWIALLLTLAATLLTAVRAVDDRWHRTILILALGALISGAVETVGSPAFHFAGVWTQFWALVGLGVRAQRDLPSVGRKGVVVLWLAALAVGGLVALGGVVYGRQLGRPQAIPRGTFELKELTLGPYAPGTVVQWQATYVDGKGRPESTFPGTDWFEPTWVSQASAEIQPIISEEIRAGGGTFAGDVTRGVKGDVYKGIARLDFRFPGGRSGLARFRAVYYDRYGRPYEAVRIVEVH